MDTLIFILAVFVWVNIALTLLFKLVDEGEGIPTDYKVLMAIIVPFIGIYLFTQYLIYKRKGVNVTMNNNVKIDVKKTISRYIDKGAIRFINLIDKLRGVYE